MLLGTNCQPRQFRQLVCAEGSPRGAGPGALLRAPSCKGPDNNPNVSPTGKYVAYTGYDSTNATWQD